MDKYLSATVKDKIKELIGDIESKSETEVAVVVAQKCDRYRYSILLYSLFVALLIPFFLKIAHLNLDQVYTFSVILASFLFVSFVLEYSDIKYKLIPKKVKKDRCETLAYEQFYKLGINKTKNHRALLIFVGLKERYIQIIADKNIDNVVEENFWNDIINDFVQSAKKGDLENALLSVVEKCGKFLEEKFPRSHIKKDNEISNEVVEL